MIEVRTDFPFLGTRDYIHGTSILDAFLDAAERLSGAAVMVKRLKLQRTATSNGRLVLAHEACAERELDAANAIFVATVDGALCHGFFAEDGSPVGRREHVSYAVSDVRAEAFGGMCRIAPANRKDLVRATIEANKRFHELTVGGSEPAVVRFGYLENWAVPPADTAFSGTLEAKNLITRKTGNGVLTINRLTYTALAGAPTSLMVCFEIAPAVKEHA